MAILMAQLIMFPRYELAVTKCGLFSGLLPPDLGQIHN